MIKSAEIRRPYPITKTCPCNAEPLKPHFYIVKLGFTGVYIFFLIFASKHRLRILVRTASLTCTHNQCFEPKKKIKMEAHLKQYNATSKHSLTNYLYRHVANYKDVSAQTVFKSVLKLKGDISFKTILYYIKLSFTKLMLD